MISSWKKIDAVMLGTETTQAWKENNQNLFNDIFNKLKENSEKGFRSVYFKKNDYDLIKIGNEDGIGIIKQINNYFLDLAEGLDIYGNPYYRTLFTYDIKDTTDRDLDIIDEETKEITVIVSFTENQEDGLYVEWGSVEKRNVGDGIKDDNLYYINSISFLYNELVETYELFTEIKQLIEEYNYIVPLEIYENFVKILDKYNQKKGMVI